MRLCLLLMKWRKDNEKDSNHSSYSFPADCIPCYMLPFLYGKRDGRSKEKTINKKITDFFMCSLVFIFEKRTELTSEWNSVLQKM